MNVDLRDWLKNGWLTEHQTSRQEIADLLGVIDRDAAQCQIPGLGPDWQLNIAYNAALQVATAALAAAGYRARARPSIIASSNRWPILWASTRGESPNCRAIGRNATSATTSEQAVSRNKKPEEMIALASELRADLTAWLAANHPELLIDKP